MPDGELSPNLPAIANAPLPALYEAAKAALAECSRLDECKDWADKYAAIASYARQSEDKTLENLARRIRARAIERCGELLKEIQPAPGTRTDLQPRGGDPPRLTRSQAASDAGLSPDQAKQAIRVANVPKPEFERLVESPNPPTIEQLADLGRQKRPAPATTPPQGTPVHDYLRGRDPGDFQQATRVLGLMRHIQERAGEIDVDAAIRGLDAAEMDTVDRGIDAARQWLDTMTGREVRAPRPDPAAQRGQPRRDGPDFWPTPPCLTTALVRFVLPGLPPAPIWECAAGDGRLAKAMSETGRKVIATDLYPQDGGEPCDFLADAPPVSARGAIVVTNPRFNKTDEFLSRGLALLDAGRITGLVLLLRHDHLQAGSRVPVLNRAIREVHCNWRPIWIADTQGNPRWSFRWFAWHEGVRQPPLYVRLAIEEAAK